MKSDERGAVELQDHLPRGRRRASWPGLSRRTTRCASPDIGLSRSARRVSRGVVALAICAVIGGYHYVMGVTTGAAVGVLTALVAITVVGGLATSTFLTLLVVPVGYSIVRRGRKPRKKA